MMPLESRDTVSQVKTPKRIAVTLDKAQRIALDRIKNETGASLAYLIRKAINEFLKKQT